MPPPHARSRQNPHHKQQPNRSGPSSSSSSNDSRQIPQTAYIQAYEAQLIYGQSQLAQELASRSDELGEGSRNRGRGLMKWQGEGDIDEEIWVDRHDILHLLPSLPTPLQSRHRSPSQTLSSSSSWSSLASDAEDTFFFSGSEDFEEYEREKKRRWIDALREERLKEREKEDVAIGIQKSPVRWESSEQPSQGILTLMRHTAKSLVSSPNHHLLEMKILANHSSDDRFSFLRGRYADTWSKIKDELRKEKENDPKKKAKEEKAVGALLGDYESSDEGDDEEEDDGDGVVHAPPDEGEVPPPPPEDSPPLPPMSQDVLSQPLTDQEVSQRGPKENRDTVEETSIATEEDKAEQQRLRRLKVEEWKRKRAEGS